MADVPYGFLRKLKVQNTVVREFLGEFLGTFILIIFGDAAFAQTILEGRRVDDVFAVVWAWGVAVMLGVATCGNVTGGHINPAVTVAFATLGKFPWRKVGHYLLAQHLGAFVASAVLFVNYKDMLDHFDPNRTVTGPTATALIWATYPKPQVSLLTCLLDQVVGTGLLMFTALAIIDEKNLNLPKWMHPMLLGFMISALAMCFGANCMAPLNPARDFATRCFTAVAGYGSEVFTYRNYWWVGLIGPHIGAIVGGWLYYLGVELHWPTTRDDEKLVERHELTVALNSANGWKVISEDVDTTTESSMHLMVHRGEIRYTGSTELQDKFPKRPTTRAWHTSFMSTGSVLHRSGAGRPSTSPENVERIRQTFQHNPKTSICQATRPAATLPYRHTDTTVYEEPCRLWL